MTWVDGKLGKALKFVGKDDYVDASNQVRFDRTNSFSYGCWMKYQDKGGALLSKMEAEPGFRGFDLLVQDGKHWRRGPGWPTCF